MRAVAKGKLIQKPSRWSGLVTKGYCLAAIQLDSQCCPWSLDKVQAATLEVLANGQRRRRLKK